MTRRRGRPRPQGVQKNFGQKNFGLNFRSLLVPLTLSPSELCGFVWARIWSARCERPAEHQEHKLVKQIPVASQELVLKVPSEGNFTLRFVWQRNVAILSRSETWVPKRGGLKPAGKRQESATFLQRSFFDVAVQFFVCCSAAVGPNDFRTAEKPMLQCSFCSAAFRKLQRNFRFCLWHVAGVGFRGVGFRTCWDSCAPTARCDSCAQGALETDGIAAKF